MKTNRPFLSHFLDSETAVLGKRRMNAPFIRVSQPMRVTSNCMPELHTLLSTTRIEPMTKAKKPNSQSKPWL